MIRQFRLLALIVFTTAGMAWPAEVVAQRHRPAPAHRGGTVHRGGTSVGVAVPRAYPSRYYRPYAHSRYYYPYSYPRYYAYSPWYYAPYYSGFGFSFGFGWPGAVWGGFGYGYPYRYAYPYAYYPPVYGYPSAVYARPAPYPPQVAERDPGQQQPSYRAGEQAGFGTLSLRVNPPDAVILIDGEVWDRPQGDPRFSIELTEGVHQIEIRKDGYGSYARTIDVYRGRVSTLNVGLTPRGAVQRPTGLVSMRQR